MKRIFLLLVFTLQGCIYQSVNINDISMATKKCASESNSEVVSIEASFAGTEGVTCSNRKSYSF